MKNAKDELINEILLKARTYMSPEMCDSFLQSISPIFQRYEVTDNSQLPSTDLAPIHKHIQMYLATKSIEGCSVNTINNYKGHIQKFFEFANRNLSDIDTNCIRAYLIYIGNDNKKSYVDLARRIINGFFEWCTNEDIISKNPCRRVKKVKTPHIIKMPFTGTEITKLQDACVNIHETALLDLLLSTGVRREEISDILISEIDWDDKKILIHGKGEKDRFVYISDRCRHHLMEHINARNFDSPFLFASSHYPHNKVCLSTLHKRIKRIGVRANVEDVHLHRFRTWFGTTMAYKGVDINNLKEMMGHSKIETTQRYYIYADMLLVQSEHCKYSV